MPSLSRTSVTNVKKQERNYIYNAGQMNCSIPIYLQLFTSYCEILVGNCNFSYPLAFITPDGVFLLEFREKIWSSEN